LILLQVKINHVMGLRMCIYSGHQDEFRQISK
jgi:hypothetical protein